MATLKIPNDIFFEVVADELETGSPVLLKVKGFSMFPFFRSEKDSALLRKYDPSAPLAKGDVALFRYNSHYVLHRCVGRGFRQADGKILTERETARMNAPGEPVFIFRGDGNPAGREWASEDDVLAVLEKRIAPSGREWGCDSFSWRLCSALWPRTRVVRRLFIGVLRRIYR